MGKWENVEPFPMMRGGRGSLFTPENQTTQKKGPKMQNRILFDGQGIPILGVFADLGKLP